MWFEIENYTIRIDGMEGDNQLTLRGEDKYARCYFMEDEVTLPSGIIHNDQTAVIYFQKSKFSWVIDVLRNEKPVFLRCSSNWNEVEKKYQSIGYITTGREPIGEEEGQA